MRWRRARRVCTTAVVAMLSLVLLAPAGASAAATANDFRLVRDKWYEYLIPAATDPRDADTRTLLTTLNRDADRYWREMVTLSEDPRRTYLWLDESNRADGDDVTNNYLRLRTMLLALKTPCTGVTGCLNGNATLRRDIMEGLDWLDAQNWYSDTMATLEPDGAHYAWLLGIPMALTDIMTIINHYGEFTGTQKVDWLAAIDVHIPPDTVHAGDTTHYFHGPGSANYIDRGEANRAWMARIFLIWGALRADAAGEAAIDATMGTGLDGLLFWQTVDGVSGFFEDGSAMDHSRHPYTGGYSAAYFEEAARILYAVAGHPLWRPTADPNIVVTWAREAYAPNIYRGGMWDFLRGRDVARSAETDHNVGAWTINAFMLVDDFAGASDARALKSLVKEWLTKDPGYYRDPYTTIFSLVNARAIAADGTVTASGDQFLARYYPVMSKATSLKTGYGFGVSTFSSDTYNYESINGEHLKGWHMADGMTMLYAGDDIDQYRGDSDATADSYWPTVDFYRLPGTTVQERETIPHQKKNVNIWTGGVSDGEYAVAGVDMNTQAETLQAKKSWFMFDDEIVALGSDIRSSAARLEGKRFETIVDNRKLNSSGNNAFTVNGAAKLTTVGAACDRSRITWQETVGWSESPMRGVRTMHLVGNGTAGASDVGYYFPTATDVYGARVRNCGSWTDINTEYPDNTVHENHFLKTWISHGTDPVVDPRVTAGRYAYAILPGYTSAATTTYSGAPEFSILKHDGDVHAVQETTRNIVQANFWNGGTQFDVGAMRPYLRSDRPVTIQVQDTGPFIYMHIADPTRWETGRVTLNFGFRVRRVRNRDAAVAVTSLNPLTVTVDFDLRRGVAPADPSRGRPFYVSFEE